MSGNYLWDRSGPPDAEVERLEQLLGQFRHQGRVSAQVHRMRLAGAIAASLVVGLGLWLSFNAPRPAETAWRVDGRAVAAGETVRAGAKDGAVLEAEGFGEVRLDPSSVLSVAESRPGLHHFDLHAGTLHAMIWAPPREFLVDTASSRAVDLGCQYTLSVDSAGDGVLSVESGWVAFLHKGKESFVPAGAKCATRRTEGPGLPYFVDAEADFAEAVRAFDAGRGNQALRRILARARSRDALTLWHLMTRAAPAERGVVFERFAQLVQVPKEVNRERVAALDPAAIDLCWNALELESAGWWRGWRRNW
jgi:hypothetical protein